MGKVGSATLSRHDGGAAERSAKRFNQMTAFHAPTHGALPLREPTAHLIAREICVIPELLFDSYLKRGRRSAGYSSVFTMSHLNWASDAVGARLVFWRVLLPGSLDIRRARIESSRVKECNTKIGRAHV